MEFYSKLHLGKMYRKHLHKVKLEVIWDSLKQQMLMTNCSSIRRPRCSKQSMKIRSNENADLEIEIQMMILLKVMMRVQTLNRNCLQKLQRTMIGVVEPLIKTWKTKFGITQTKAQFFLINHGLQNRNNFQKIFSRL